MSTVEPLNKTMPFMSIVKTPAVKHAAPTLKKVAQSSKPGELPHLFSEHLNLLNNFVRENVLIVDANKHPINKLIAYNTYTKKAIRYKTDKHGKVLKKGNKPEVETVYLPDSYIQIRSAVK